MRILLADDHVTVRGVVRDILEAEGWEVCGEAGDGREAVRMAILLAPDAAILDLSMPEMNGLEASRQILRQQPRIPIVLLTLHETADLEDAALACGVRACVTKTDLPRLVREMKALFRSTFATPYLDFSAQQADEDRDRLMARLNESELKVLELLAQSKTNREIARALSMDLDTVQSTKAAIVEKLESESILTCIRYALRRAAHQGR